MSKILATQFIGPPLDLAFIEIGANHPFSTSNTYLLEKELGISGILVEANPKLIPALEKHRPNAQVINAAVVDNDEHYAKLYVSVQSEISSLLKSHLDNWYNPEINSVIQVPAMRIDEVLALLPNKDIILSVDVEGMDLRLLKDMSFDIKPFIIQAEAPGDKFRYEMIQHMTKNGYELFGLTYVNILFVRK
jgi:FkbM family methyltransferase